MRVGHIEYAINIIDDTTGDFGYNVPFDLPISSSTWRPNAKELTTPRTMALLNVLLTVSIMSMVGTMSVKTEGEGISGLELRSAGAVGNGRGRRPHRK